MIRKIDMTKKEIVSVSKKTIILPYTNQLEENMIIYRSKKDEYISLYKTETIEKKISKIDQLYQNEKEIEKRKQIRKIKRNFIGNCYEVTIKNGQLAITKEWPNFDKSKKVVLVHYNDHIKIFSNNESYEKYKQKINKKIK